jgi:hypothetical protein
VRHIRVVHSSERPAARGSGTQISGRVTNAQTQQGLGEATVAVTGTGIVAETNDGGNFVVNAPDGDYGLTANLQAIDRPGPPLDVIFPMLPIPTAETQPRT